MRKQTISICKKIWLNQSVGVVCLCISADHKDDMQLFPFIVPLMCDPLQSQSIVQGSVTHAHFKGLKLANYSTGEDDIMVDMLVS